MNGLDIYALLDKTSHSLKLTRKSPANRRPSHLFLIEDLLGPLSSNTYASIGVKVGRSGTTAPIELNGARKYIRKLCPLQDKSSLTINFYLRYLFY